MWIDFKKEKIDGRFRKAMYVYLVDSKRRPCRLVYRSYYNVAQERQVFVKLELDEGPLSEEERFRVQWQAWHMTLGNICRAPQSLHFCSRNSCLFAPTQNSLSNQFGLGNTFLYSAIRIYLLRIAMAPSPISPNPVTRPISFLFTWFSPPSPINCLPVSTR